MGAALLPGSGSRTEEIRHMDFEEWGAVFRDKVMAAALVDRLQHTLPQSSTSAGNSCRMPGHLEMWASSQPPEA